MGQIYLNFKFEFPAFLAGAVLCVRMDSDLYITREEGGQRQEAGAVRDELDNQASRSKNFSEKFLKSFQRLSETYKDHQRLTEISLPSK